MEKPIPTTGTVFQPILSDTTHIAFGSIRMEPVFMIPGQSSAVIACLAIHEDTAVQELEFKKVKQVLIKHGQIVE